MSSSTDQFVEQNRERLLDELKQFLRIPSISTLPEHGWISTAPRSSSPIA